MPRSPSLVPLLAALALLLPPSWALLVAAGPTGAPGSHGLVAVLSLLGDPVFLEAAARALVRSVLVTVVTLAVAIPAGYLIARRAVPGAPLLFGWLIATGVVPPVLLLSGVAGLARARGTPLDGWAAAVVPEPLAALVPWVAVFAAGLAQLVVTLPIAVWILQRAFAGVPTSVDESARLDGLSWRTFVGQVLWPAVAPAVRVAGLGTFAVAWSETVLVGALSDGDLPARVVAMVRLASDGGPAVGSVAAAGSGWPVAAAAAALLCLPALAAVAGCWRLLERPRAEPPARLRRGPGVRENPVHPRQPDAPGPRSSEGSQQANTLS